MTAGSDAFVAARDLLLEQRENYEAAYEQFSWPDLDPSFNWARDYFDHVAATVDQAALTIVDEGGAETSLTYAELSSRSKQVANLLTGAGLGRGDRVLLMLGNQVELWEIMLAAMRAGIVVIPATTILTGDDLADRFQRGAAAMVIANDQAAASVDALPAELTDGVAKMSVGGRDGWSDYAAAGSEPTEFETPAEVRADDPLLEYFTSGTTSKPKIVRHTQVSYPVGHLSTMYWLGIQPGDVHWTLSSPGWAKHAWGCFFAPFNAQATVFLYNYTRFDAPAVLDVLVRYSVNTICAPPTVWRALIQEDISAYEVALRELLSAGEPLNPEVIAQVEKAWGITIRDGYGQTETTAQVGNPPGAPLVPGSMGRPLPGYRMALLDADGNEADEGELSIAMGDDRPIGLMVGYVDDDERTAAAMADGWYRTGDVVSRDEDGFITYVGRSDDVFKSSGYRISPFELESVLIEHPAVAEAAVVPSPDDIKGQVPKAYIVVAPGHDAGSETAGEIFGFVRERVSGYKLVRRLEFADLPKTVSGKIRRVELRGQELARDGQGPRTDAEFIEKDLRQG
jgi:acetyl-CoA synthetase